jgi:hypothetical protein
MINYGYCVLGFIVLHLTKLKNIPMKNKYFHLVAGFILFTSVAAVAQNVCYAPDTKFPGGYGPSHVVSGDLNNDGYIDVVVNNVSSKTASVFLGDGVGGFMPTASYYFLSSWNINDQIVLEDFDNNGILDLVYTNCGTNDASIMFGNGWGGFYSPVSFSMGWCASWFTTGDFNNDGNADIVAGIGATNNSLAILKGNGNGGFYNFTQFGGTAYSTTIQLKANDIDGDGSLDLLVFADSLYTLINDGSANFTQTNAVEYTISTWNYCRSFFNDYNNDGFDDVYFKSSHYIMIYAGDGTGAFSPIDTVDIEYNEVGDFDLKDLDNDGDKDIVVSYQYLNLMAVYYQGTNGFDNAQYIYIDNVNNISSWASASFHGIVAEDFDGDGVIDIFSSNSNNDNVSLFPNHLLTGDTLTNIVSAADVTTCPGGSLYFQLQSNETDTFSYNWYSFTQGHLQYDPWVGYYYNSSFSNDTSYSAYLNAANLTQADSGLYFSVVNNGYCVAASKPFAINVVSAENSFVNICMVTVDTTSSHNEILWNKEEFMYPANITGFNIYKVVGSNDSLIGFVPLDSLSSFIDTTSNPNVTAVEYKVAVTDTCGTEGPRSSVHQTIHLIANQGLGQINLQWNSYAGNWVNNYELWRYTGTSGWVMLNGTINPNTNSWSDLSAPMGDTTLGYYIATTFGTGCEPTRALISTSRSNIKNPIAPESGVGIEEQINTQVSIYPNPAKDLLNADLRKLKGQTVLHIYNSIGQLVFEKNCFGGTLQAIEVGAFSNGLYTLEILNSDARATLKISIQH